MVLYLFRAVAYEIPHYGGRAQGRRRPQAPTLTERPNGRKRTFSITGPSPNRSAGDEKEAKKRRSFDSDREDMDDITEEGSQMSDRLSSWGMRLIRTESRAMRSTDLWDASTDSRFISGPNATKKRR